MQLPGLSFPLEPADEGHPVVVPHNRQRREGASTRQHRPLLYVWAVLLNIQAPCNHGVPAPILQTEQLFLFFESPVDAFRQNYRR